MDPHAELNKLRQRLDEIDEEIVKLLAERFKIVRDIATIKLKLNLPVIDQSREDEVKKRWIELSSKLSIPTQLTLKILDVILQYSKVVQVTQRGQRWRGKVSIAIVGAGCMGQTLYSLIRLAGIDVALVPARSITNMLHEVQSGNIVIFATRPEFFYSDTFRKVVEILKEDTIVMDILSVKGQLFDYIESLVCGRGLTYISAHPLFGPLDLAVGENIILIPSRCTEPTKLELVRELLQDLGLNVTILRDKEEHDYYMSLIQVAHHVYYLALMRLKRYIEKAGIDISKVSTHSFRHTLQRLERFRSLLRTLLEIQLLNKYASQARQIAHKLLDELINCLDRSDNIDSAMTCLDVDPTCRSSVS